MCPATRRKVDDLLYPQRGYSMTVQAGGAVEETFSDRRFLAPNTARSIIFHPMSDAQTLILRAELGGRQRGRAQWHTR